MIEQIAGDFHGLSTLTLIISTIGVCISMWGTFRAILEYRRVVDVPRNPKWTRRWSDRLLNGSHRHIALIHVVRETVVLMVQMLGCGIAMLSLTLPDLRGNEMAPWMLHALAWRRLASLVQSVILSMAAIWMRLSWERVLAQIDNTHHR